MSVQSQQVPLNLKNYLAETPKTPPKYKVAVENSQGKSVDCGDPKITRALVLLMDFHSVYGGAASHWGGPAAMAEIVSAVHGLMFSRSKANNSSWYQNFHFVNDAGHTENGIYALRANLNYGQLSFEDLWKFRSIEGPLTGHGEAHVYPEGVYLSNGPLGSAVPQSEGLACADRLIQNNRTTICLVSDGACMEGEAKEAFASIPGLAAKGKLNPYVLLVSDNNTKLSGRISDDAFSMEESMATFTTLGWDHRIVEDGHDLQKVFSAIESALDSAQKDPSRPVCLQFKTIKGKGIKDTEKSSSGGHGFPLKKGDTKIISYLEEIFDGNPPKEFIEYAQHLLDNGKQVTKTRPLNTELKVSETSEKVQVGISNALIEAKENALPIVSVSADLQGSTGLDPFRKKYPDCSIEVGVAESNMVSLAAGLSKVGMIPVVDTFAQFGITKGNLPLIMSSLSQAPIIGVFSHTGFQDAADGASHQATTYFSATASIPNVQVVCLSCSSDAQVYMTKAIEYMTSQRQQGNSCDSIIFFLGRENFPSYYNKDLSFEWGKMQVLLDKSQDDKADVLIVGCGPMVQETLTAAHDLVQSGLRPIVVNNPFINRPDMNQLTELLRKCNNRIVTVEDHQVVGGMGQILSHKLLQEGVGQIHLKSLGIQGGFGRSAYMAGQLYQANGLSSSDIAVSCINLIKQTS